MTEFGWIGILISIVFYVLTFVIINKTVFLTTEKDKTYLIPIIFGLLLFGSVGFGVFIADLIMFQK